MSEIPSNIMWFIVAISVLVAIHEYGHYIVGRLCGMKVLRFSIGFGRPLWTWVGKDPDRTEYCVSAIPLGGYVKFLDEREGPVDDADKGRAFNHRPIMARIAVLLAGPLFNFLFAIVAYWLLFAGGVPALKPAVGSVELESYAAEAGLKYGDRIVSVAGQNVADWEDALVLMIDEMVGDGRISLVLEREDAGQVQAVISVGDDSARLTEPGILFDGLGFQPWQPPAVVASTTPGGAAEAAGIESGDEIIRIDGEAIQNFSDLQRVVSERPGRSVVIEYQRGGRDGEVDATIGSVEQDGLTLGLLGVAISRDYGDLLYNRKFGLVGSIRESMQQTWNTTAFTGRMLYRMATGAVSIRNISGPISIAQYAGESASAGFDRFVRFLALISISLGVLNLLPIPILDGGQIVYQAIEGLKGSPLSERFQILGQQFGILALLMLMSFAFYNDISRLFS